MYENVGEVWLQLAYSLPTRELSYEGPLLLTSDANVVCLTMSNKESDIENEFTLIQWYVKLNCHQMKLYIEFMTYISDSRIIKYYQALLGCVGCFFCLLYQTPCLTMTHIDYPAIFSQQSFPSGFWLQNSAKAPPGGCSLWRLLERAILCMDRIPPFCYHSVTILLPFCYSSTTSGKLWFAVFNTFHALSCSQAIRPSCCLSSRLSGYCCIHQSLINAVCKFTELHTGQKDVCSYLDESLLCIDSPSCSIDSHSGPLVITAIGLWRSLFDLYRQVFLCKEKLLSMTGWSDMASLQINTRVQGVI